MATYIRNLCNIICLYSPTGKAVTQMVLTTLIRIYTVNGTDHTHAYT